VRRLGGRAEGRGADGHRRAPAELPEHLASAALYRLRTEDFGEVRHHDSISPAWPISYTDMEPYYTQAERLYQVHGEHGVDPTDPPASAQYAFPPVSHELDNLYVVDTSFFPSIGAVNPSLTAIANALRVGDHIDRPRLSA
jgi:choline dehydrogenase-like flavoprotein